MTMTVHIIVVTFMKIKQKLVKGSLQHGHLNCLQKSYTSQPIFTKDNHNIQLNCLVLRLSCGICGLYIKIM